MSAILPNIDAPIRAAPRTPIAPRRTARHDEHPQWLYQQHKALHPEQHPEPNIMSGGQARGLAGTMNQDNLLVTNVKVIRPFDLDTRKRAAFTNDGLDNSIKAPSIPFSPETQVKYSNLR
jgi:hypothetical protein